MTALPVELLQRPVQLRGSAFARALLRLAGWHICFDGLPAAQGVAIAYPHTSNWDFVVGILAKWGIGIPVSFWGKDSLFRVPLVGRWLRWVGWLTLNEWSVWSALLFWLSLGSLMAGQLIPALGRRIRFGVRLLWLWRDSTE